MYSAIYWCADAECIRTPEQSGLFDSLRCKNSIIVNGALVVGKLATGRMYDRLDIMAPTSISCLWVLVGLAGLIYAGNNAAIALIVIGYGFGVAFLTIANPVISEGLFGGRGYGSANGALTVANDIGGAIGSVFSGYIYDDGELHPCLCCYGFLLYSGNYSISVYFEGVNSGGMLQRLLIIFCTVSGHAAIII